MASENSIFFAEHGWLLAGSVWTREEAAEVREELMKLVEAGIGTEKVGDTVKRHASADYKSAFAAEVHEPSRFSPYFKQLVTSSKIGAIMREVMGARRIRLFRDLGLIKGANGEGGRGTGLHQDQVYYPFDRRCIATMWIALVDLPSTGSTMRFIDGSHKFGPAGRTSTPIPEWLAAHPGEADLLTPPPALEAGSATIHEGFTLHGSDANAWDQPRIAMSLTYFDADALYNGMPSRWTDGLGLEIDEPIEHDFFPLVN